ncbi:unnamed protein product, partial [Hapterophycus canaliculatus]
SSLSAAAAAAAAGVAGAVPTTTAAGAGGVREEAMALELPDDNGQMVCVLLQTLSQSFMANPAAAHGLSAALAPPAATGGGGGASGVSGTPASLRSSPAGAGGAGPGSVRENVSQHTVSVSLGKAWLEILVKLMRRASDGGIAAGGDEEYGPGTAPSGGAAGVAAAAAAAASAAAAGAAGSTTPGAAAGASVAVVSSSASAASASLVEGRKAPAWADPALVLRSLVLLREVLARVPDAYVVPLRRRGVLHSIRTVADASTAPPLVPGGSQTPPPPPPSPPSSPSSPSSLSLSAAIHVATKDIIDLCDEHQSLRAARSLNLAGGGAAGATGAGTGVEEVDRLVATASSLKEAVGVLRRHTAHERGSGGGAASGAGESVGAAGRRAIMAVRELAGLLASE